MNKVQNNKAWWLVLPVFLLVAFSACTTTGPDSAFVSSAEADAFNERKLQALSDESEMARWWCTRSRSAAVTEAAYSAGKCSWFTRNLISSGCTGLPAIALR